jgi:hypothetical protein
VAEPGTSTGSASGHDEDAALEYGVDLDASPHHVLRHGLSLARPARKKDVAEWRRQQLIIATLLCMAENGIQQTTIEEITSRANVSRGLIRHHFKNKRELLIHACKYLCDDFRIFIESHARDYEQDPWRALDYLVRTIFETRISMTPRYQRGSASGLRLERTRACKQSIWNSTIGIGPIPGICFSRRPIWDGCVRMSITRQTRSSP